MLICIPVLLAAIVLIGCASRKPVTGDAGPGPLGDPGETVSGPETQNASSKSTGGKNTGGKNTGGKNTVGKLFGSKAEGSAPYAVKSELRELFSVDPRKGIGVYGRYTELTAQGEVPEALSRVLAEANARAKESVEAKAARYLAENHFPPAAGGMSVTERYRYHNISYIVNVTRADDVLFSILETETESGIGIDQSDWINPLQTGTFRASVYETESGRLLTPEDFLQDPGSLPERLEAALANKYSYTGLYPGAGQGTPAWTADYLGLHFYFDGTMIPDQKLQELGANSRKAVHVSIPYTALDGPLVEAAAGTPENFIAQLEKNTEYALPFDKRVIRIEKAVNDGGYEQYRLVIRDNSGTKAWWLEYANDASDFFVFRSGNGYYFYRLEDGSSEGFIYNFASPDGGFDRFAHQNAQIFDSFLHELCLAVPYDPECVHMRERTRKFMDSVNGMNTTYVPHGHYAFRPEPGRGRTWLHFALTDDVLVLDSHNVGCRLLHEISATGLDDVGNETGEVTVPAGEVLKFLRVDGESELYYYMSSQYSMYSSGARDYFYDCALSDGRLVRLVTRYENSFFVDGMYMDRIGEPVTLGAAQYEAGLGEVQEHSVEIGGKEYKLIRDLSLKSEYGEEIDFNGDIWWIVENYVGTFTSEDGDAKLVISENGDVSFDFEGKHFTGKLPERRFYHRDVMVYMEAGYERRTFQIIVTDDLPDHDPSFTGIEFYSEGLPATNEPSTMPPIMVNLVRE